MINITRRFRDAVLKVAGGSGGGGTDTFHPLFKLNLTVDQDMYIFDEGVVWVSDGRTYTANGGKITQLTADNGTFVEANTPVSIDVAMQIEEGTAFIIPYVFLLTNWPEETVSFVAKNLVNCTFINDDGIPVFIITDPTKDASADFNVTFPS